MHSDTHPICTSPDSTDRARPPAFRCSQSSCARRAGHGVVSAFKFGFISIFLGWGELQLQLDSHLHCIAFELHRIASRFCLQPAGSRQLARRRRRFAPYSSLLFFLFFFADSARDSTIADGARVNKTNTQQVSPNKMRAAEAEKAPDSRPESRYVELHLLLLRKATSLFQTFKIQSSSRGNRSRRNTASTEGGDPSPSPSSSPSSSPTIPFIHPPSIDSASASSSAKRRVRVRTSIKYSLG